MKHPEFPFARSAAKRKALIALDYPLGDADLKPPVKRPRRQVYLWSAFCIPPRQISRTLAGTLAKLDRRGKELRTILRPKSVQKHS